MASSAQIKANRVNARNSTGPRDTSRTRFNGLKHGLRAEIVVVPGEDPAAFDAQRAAFFDDWRPGSHTRARLVDRLAAAARRLDRAVRAEAALARAAADRAGRDFDEDQRARVDRAVARFNDDPMAALSLLESHATGIDRLIRSWRGLGEYLARGRGPSGWDRPEYHARLMVLLGRRLGAAAGGPEDRRRGGGDGGGPAPAGGGAPAAAPGDAPRGGRPGGAAGAGRRRRRCGDDEGGGAAAPLRDGARPGVPRDDQAADGPGAFRRRPAGAGARSRVGSRARGGPVV